MFQMFKLMCVSVAAGQANRPCAEPRDDTQAVQRFDDNGCAWARERTDEDEVQAPVSDAATARRNGAKRCPRRKAACRMARAGVVSWVYRRVIHWVAM